MYIGKCIFQYNWHQLKEECLLKSLKVYNDYINKSHNICSWVTGSLKLLFRNIFIFIFKRHFANLLFLENFKNEETRVWEILVTNSHWLWDLYTFQWKMISNAPISITVQMHSFYFMTNIKYSPWNILLSHFPFRSPSIQHTISIHTFAVTIHQPLTKSSSFTLQAFIVCSLFSIH